MLTRQLIAKKVSTARNRAEEDYFGCYEVLHIGSARSKAVVCEYQIYC